MASVTRLKWTASALICILALVLPSCRQEQNPRGGSNSARSTATSPAPGATDILPTTPSPLPTEYYATMTFEADPRLEAYIFPSDIDPEICQVIQLTLEERTHYTSLYGKHFTSFVLLQPVTSEDGGRKKAYLFAVSREFYVEEGELKQGGGGQIPAAITMEKFPEGWLTDLETPLGGNWGTRLQEIFPDELLDLLGNFPSAISSQINENIIKQAESHFGLIFNAEKNSFPPAGPTPTPAIVLLTLTPTPTVDLQSLTPHVRARSLVSMDHISIGVNLYDGVTRDFQKGLVSADWHVYLFTREADEVYNLQDGLLLDDYKYYDGASGNEFSIRIPLERVLAFSGENRGLVYQVIDKDGTVHWEEEIYLGRDLEHEYFIDEGRDFPNDYSQDVDDGVLLGFPNLMENSSILIFTSANGEHAIQEPPGGFFSLTYHFGISHASGITATVDLEELSDKLRITLFPFRETGDYSGATGTLLEGKISGGSGVLTVSFPHAWLDVKRYQLQSYWLLIQDDEGEIYLETKLDFIPQSYW